MSKSYVLKYDTYNNTLIISKDSKRKDKKVKDGKYGIQGYYDIKNNITCLRIPEPDLLFGINKKDLENFFKDELV